MENESRAMVGECSEEGGRWSPVLGCDGDRGWRSSTLACGEDGWWVAQSCECGERHGEAVIVDHVVTVRTLQRVESDFSER